MLCIQNSRVVTGLCVRNVWRWGCNNGSKVLQFASIQSSPLANHDGGGQEEIEAAERLGGVLQLAWRTWFIFHYFHACAIKNEWTKVGRDLPAAMANLSEAAEQKEINLWAVGISILQLHKILASLVSEPMA